MREMLRIQMAREGFAAARADENGVDALARAMKEKLHAKRLEGYGGWNKPDECTVEHLAKLLLDHLPKGDPVDIANFAMMLFNRDGGADALRAEAASPAGREREGSRDELLNEINRLQAREGELVGALEKMVSFIDGNEPPGTLIALASARSILSKLREGVDNAG